MRKFRLLIVALLMGVVVGALEGCHRRELLDPSFTTQMNVKVDIRSLANVTCDVYNEKIPLPVIEPEMMRVLFYKPGTNIVAGESYISAVSTDAEGRCGCKAPRNGRPEEPPPQSLRQYPSRTKHWF